ncbi:MAG: hypothetical protein AMXMBFR33_12070 [Candidatus Xenobia bacterium]
MDPVELSIERCFAVADLAAADFEQTDSTKQCCPECGGKLTYLRRARSSRIACVRGDFQVVYLEGPPPYPTSL